MNRTWSFLKPAPAPCQQPAFQIESGLFSPSSHDAAQALFAPLHYERGYSYPLIVWLHGPNTDERQLLRVMPLVSMRNYVAVAPQGVLAATAGDAGKAGYTWSQSEEHIQQAQQRVFESIEAVGKRFHIAPDRIFLAGFDCGGTMAFRIGLNHPRRFAGVISLGGAFPNTHTPLANLPQARALPIFLAAGRASQVYPEAEVCADLRLLHAAGLSITLRLYPCGHELTPQMLSDVDRWIIEQITSGSTPAFEADRLSPREAE